MSYDIGCLELANKFLSDATLTEEHRRKLADKLSQGIQNEIESFLEEEQLKV